MRGGTLKVGNVSALGATSGPTVVTNGATLDFNHLNVGLEPVIAAGAGVDGKGALADFSGNPNYVSPNVAYVTLAGDTTFGGTGRWDLRSASTASTNAVLGTAGHAYKLTKVGTNQVSLVAVLVDPALADIDVQAGILSLEKVITSLGNPTNSLSVSNGATLQFYQVSNVLNKVLVLRGGATIANNNGSNTFGGPVTLQGTNTFNVGGTSLTLSNSVGGLGGLVKTGTGTLYCAATNRYSGSTLVNTGMLALIGSGEVSGSSTIAIAAGATLSAAGRGDGQLTLAAGQALGGDGTVLGNLTVGIGALVAPGASAGVVGTLTVANTVTLQGMTRMKLKPSAATNDVLQSGAGILYGGTLSVTNLGGTLAAGSSFKLFSGTSYSGAFTTFVPPMPGPGLAWDPAGLTNGTLRIVAAPKPVITGIAQSGLNLTFTGTNGIANAPYYLLACTNLALPLTNWTRAVTNVFDESGQFSCTTTMDPNLPQQFYRVLLGP